jgi:hypothetical protein
MLDILRQFIAVFVKDTCPSLNFSNKTRLSAGLELFAAQRWPAFDAFVVVSFPV